MHILKGLELMSAQEAREIAGVPDEYLEGQGDPAEIGLMLVWDSETGEHFTHLAAAEYVHMLMEGEDTHIIDEEIRFPPEVAPLVTPGWPSDWAAEGEAPSKD